MPSNKEEVAKLTSPNGHRGDDPLSRDINLKTLMRGRDAKYKKLDIGRVRPKTNAG